MTRKPDTIGYKEFNKLSEHSDAHHFALPSEVLFDDENTNQNEEVLMGMEFELEELDEIKNEDELEDDEDKMELADIDDEDEDDINADITDEIDESAQFEGRHT